MIVPDPREARTRSTLIESFRVPLHTIMPGDVCLSDSKIFDLPHLKNVIVHRDFRSAEIPSIIKY